jgi:hypothetical protein
MEAETVVLRDETRDNLRFRHTAANWRLLANSAVGVTESEIVTSFLDLAPSAFAAWWKMEELALEHEHVSSEIIGENLEAAVEKRRKECTRRKSTIQPCRLT